MDHCPVVSGRTKGFTGCDLADFGALPTDLLALKLLVQLLIANKASKSWRFDSNVRPAR